MFEHRVGPARHAICLMARLGGALNLRGVAFANLTVEQIQRHSALFTAVETKTGLSLRSADLFVLHFPEGSDANTMNQADGSILFVSTGHGGQTNALISIASELSRRDVANLWFASTDNHRVDIAGAASGSPIYFASCGITDRIKELVEDPAIYATFANQGPLTSNSFVVAMRWMLDEERLTVERPVYRTIAVGLSCPWFGFAASNDCCPEAGEPLVSIAYPDCIGHPILVLLLCRSSKGGGNKESFG